MKRQVSVWILDFERKASETLQRAIDRIPMPKDGKDGISGKDGKDGIDGLGFDDLSMVQLDAKRFKLVFQSGESKKEFVVKMPVVVDAGVYEYGKDYYKGDGVTYAGSFWIAQVDGPNQSPGKPDTGKASEWRLAVKKGKDAREARA